MFVQPPHTSVFTFRSAVHSAYVLRCLNDQRLQDVLCDVTVVVGHKSFRAHCSVLASCSKYFHSKVINITSQSPIITLSDEVSVEGFEPLLQFAYTSKLPFTKDNIHAIQRSAEFLGFHNLESACFDFLMPKFSDGRGTSQEVRHRSCCQNPNPTASIGSGLESNQPKSVESHSSIPSRGDEPSDFSSQCPQSAQSQSNNTEEHFCLENCGPQMPSLSMELSENEVCPMLSLPCPNPDKADHRSQFCERDILGIGGACTPSALTLADCGLPCELSTPGNGNLPELIEPSGSRVTQAVEMPGAENDCNSGSCPLNTSGDCRDLLQQSEVSLEQSMAGDISDPACVLSQEEGFWERSSVEREVAEHMANILGFWSNLCPSQTPRLHLDHTEQNSQPKASDIHCLKQLDLSSSVGDCPFLKDLEEGNDPAQCSDSLSPSERGPCISSSHNSGDDTDLDTDGDTEANNQRAVEIQLPFPVEQISSLSRSAFQQLLRNHQLTEDQLEFVHDIRRRSKNRVAAQRCRKRKQEGVHHLECEIKRLTSEKEQLLHEKTLLEQNLEETRQSLCRLCKSVSIKSGSHQDHLHFLAKLSSADPSIFSPSLEGKDEESQITIEMIGSSSEYDPNQPPEGSLSTVVQSSSQQSRPDPPSLLNACLNINNIL